MKMCLCLIIVLSSLLARAETIGADKKYESYQGVMDVSVIEKQTAEFIKLNAGVESRVEVVSIRWPFSLVEYYEYSQYKLPTYVMEIVISADNKQVAVSCDMLLIPESAVVLFDDCTSPSDLAGLGFTAAAKSPDTTVGVPIPFMDKEIVFTFSPIESTSWSLGFAIPYEDLGLPYDSERCELVDVPECVNFYEAN